MGLVITDALVLPESLLLERFVRASGPGGQNVNKVATAVELRLRVGDAPIEPDAKARLRALAGGRLSSDDELVIEAREHRTQLKNREAARGRLAALVRQALVKPKARRKTKPTKAAKERRLEGKIKRARLKQGRRPGRHEE